MPRKLCLWLAALLGLGCLALFWRFSSGSAAMNRVTSSPVLTPTPLPNQPLEPALPKDSSNMSAPEISAVTLNSAQCYLPEPQTDACYIQWPYLQVSATNSQYMISMTVSISNHIQAYYSGFFQSSMYVPSDMNSPGFRVECGLPGASGVPTLGKSYPWLVLARETGGLMASGSGVVTCPPDIVPVAHGNISGPAAGLTGHAYAFTASVPANTSLPITYTWTVSGHPVVTVTGGISNTQSYTWNSGGTDQVAVEVSNRAGQVSLAKTIDILVASTGKRVYLPLVIHHR